MTIVPAEVTAKAEWRGLYFDTRKAIAPLVVEELCQPQVKNGRGEEKRLRSMKTYLDIKDVKEMESCAFSLRDRLLIRLLFHLGCRVSEALAITVSDIDFEKATITILHLKTRSILLCPYCKARLSRRHRFCPECGVETGRFVNRENKLRKQRVLPVDKDTLELLKEYIHQNIAVTPGNPRLIFYINRHRAWQIVRNCAQRAGIPNLTNPETGKVRCVSPHRLVKGLILLLICSPSSKEENA